MPLQNRVTPAAELPDGVMILAGGEPGLLIGGQSRPWSFGGYGAPAPAGPADRVEVLTPPSIVAAITAGYRPLVHPSALPSSVPASSRPAGAGSAQAAARVRIHMTGAGPT